MSNRNEYIFDLEAEVLKHLQLLRFDSSFSLAIGDPAPKEPSVPLDITKVNGTEVCLTCNYTFEPGLPHDKKKQHYRSDLHRLNLKRSLNGLPALSESEFEDLLETQSLNSISGSDESESELDSEEQRLPEILEKLSVKGAREEDAEEELPVSHMNTESPFILLRSHLTESTKALGVYKAMFPVDVLAKGTIIQALEQYNEAKSRSGHSVLFMIGGGHFAGAVISHARLNIKGNVKNHKDSIAMQKVSVVESKTFHRYTTRRKQGGSQSASDNANGKANSAGSSIRRYNEQALIKEVRELLTSWKRHIDGAEHIFIRANGIANRKILVGYEGSPLKLADQRIRTFPFTTRRATLSEVKNAWTKLTYLVDLEIPTPKKIAKTTAAPEIKQKPVTRPEVLLSDKHTSELLSAMKRSKAPLLINYLRTNQLSVQVELTPYEQFANTPTLLHYASSQGLSHMVRVLLVNLKADPLVMNKLGRTAAQVRQNDHIMSVFQICRSELGEEYCDWSAAHVGPPETSEEVAKREAQIKSAAQEENRNLISKELAKPTQTEKKEPRFSSSGVLGGGTVMTKVSETSGLTDQQKMRLMREQRARAAEARMRGRGT